MTERIWFDDIEGAGGGGCFVAGTLVDTPDGQVPIQKLEIGDTVLSFDQKGIQRESKITATHCHADKKVIEVGFWGGSIKVTPNHWFLNEYNRFTEIGDYKINDALTDILGSVCPITSIDQIAGVCNTYDITVEPHHTFFAESIRVHNKGGGKGSGGTVTHTPTESPDSLRSKATVKVLDLVSEGPIVGLVDGTKSVFFDETALESSDGSFNFENVTLETRLGAADQEVIPGFSSIEQERAVGIQITQEEGPVVRTINNSDATALRIRVRIPSLLEQLPNGDLIGSSVQFKIEIKPFGGTWISPVTDKLYQSFTSLSPADTTAIQANAEFVAAGGTSQTEVYRIEVQYRLVSSSTWTTFGVDTGIIENDEILTIDPVTSAAVGTGVYQGGVAKKTFQVTELPAGQYEVRAVSGIVVDKFSYSPTPLTISGKSTQVFERSYRIKLPANSSPIDIRLIRVSPDNASAAAQNDIFWEAYVEVIEQQLIYPNSAIMALTSDAATFGGRIPKRSFDIKGLIIKVPSNYFPEGRPIPNVLYYSGDLDHGSPWFSSGVTVNQDHQFLTDPFGDNKATQLIEDTSTGSHHVTQVASEEFLNAGSVAMGSVYVRPGKADACLLSIRDQTAGDILTVQYNLLTGVVVNIYTSSSGVTDVDAGIIADKEGFFRLYLKARVNGTTKTPRFDIKISHLNRSWTYTGDGESDIFVRAPMLNESSNLLEYVETAGSAVNTNELGNPRYYDGFWDGTLKDSWSDNPAWIFYDLLSNDRYGLGEFIDITRVDIGSLYTIGKYCDELVDDGLGGVEPRFTVNTQITSQTDAIDLLNMIVSSFRGMMYFSTGLISAAQDSPKDSSRVVNNSNVINGDFDYKTPALRARHSVALVSWNNPGRFYKQDFEAVESPTLIRKYGWRDLPVAAFGCTSRGLANRVGRWVLDNEEHGSEIVSFKGGLDFSDCVPGEVMDIMDQYYGGVRYGGRVSQATLVDVTLDAEVDLLEGETYTVSVVIPSWGTVSVTNGSTNVVGSDTVFNNRVLPGDAFVLHGDTRRYEIDAVNGDTGIILVENFASATASDKDFIILRGSTIIMHSANTVVSETVTNAFGPTNLLSLENPLPKVPEKGALWALVGSNVAPRKFRVVANREVEPHVYEIAATLHDVNKYARVEDNLILDPVDFTDLPSGRIEPPSSLAATEYLTKESGNVLNAVNLSWRHSTDSRVNFYSVEILRPNGVFAFVGNTSQNTLDIIDTPEGVYGFRVAANGGGEQSVFVTLSSVVIEGFSAPPGDVQNFDINIVGDQAFLTWDKNTEFDLSGYYIRHSPTIGLGVIFQSSIQVVPKIGKEVTGSTVPAMVGTYLIKAVDEAGVLSKNSAIVVTTIGGGVLNVVETLSHPPFTGTMENVEYSSVFSRLILQGQPTSVKSEGTYYLYDKNGGSPWTFDLGNTYRCRLSSILDMDAFNFSDFFDSRSGLFDSQSGDFDNEALLQEVKVEWFISTTENDPSDRPQWTEFKSLTVGDYVFRAIRAKIVLTTNLNNISPAIKELSLEIDMPDRIEGDKNITTSAGAATTITFAPAFNNLKSFGVTISDAASTDKYVEISKSNTQVTFEIQDESNTRISRTVDWQAQGYGYRGAAPDPSAVLGATVTGGLFSLFYSGFAPAVTTTVPNINLIAGAGRFKVAGYKPTLDITFNLPLVAGTGTFAIVGKQPGVSIAKIEAGTGIFAIAGHDPALTIGVAQEFELEWDIDSEFVNDVSLTAGQGTLGYLGKQPDLTTQASVTADLTVQWDIISGDMNESAGKGTLEILGKQPTVSAASPGNISLTAGKGTLEIDGKQPTVVTNSGGSDFSSDFGSDFN